MDPDPQLWNKGKEKKLFLDTKILYYKLQRTKFLMKESTRVKHLFVSVIIPKKLRNTNIDVSILSNKKKSGQIRIRTKKFRNPDPSKWFDRIRIPISGLIVHVEATYIEEGFIQKRSQIPPLLFGGTDFIEFLSALAI